MTTGPSKDDIDHLNRALHSAEPVKVAAALYAISHSRTIEREGSNLRLWDVLQILHEAGLTLSVQKTPD